MINLTRAEFNAMMVQEIDRIREIFTSKNDQYSKDGDPLSNFTLGALLKYHTDSMDAKYEVAKDYVNKHIAHVYGNSIEGKKVGESLTDIAVYMLIMEVMRKLNERDKNSLSMMGKESMPIELKNVLIGIDVAKEEELMEKIRAEQKPLPAEPPFGVAEAISRAVEVEPNYYGIAEEAEPRDAEEKTYEWEKRKRADRRDCNKVYYYDNDKQEIQGDEVKELPKPLVAGKSLVAEDQWTSERNKKVPPKSSK